MFLFTDYKQAVSIAMKRNVVTPMSMTNNSNAVHHVIELEQVGISPFIIMEGKQKVGKQIMSKEDFPSPSPFSTGLDFDLKEGNLNLTKQILTKKEFPFSHSAVERNGGETGEYYRESSHFRPKIFINSVSHSFNQVNLANETNLSICPTE